MSDETIGLLSGGKNVNFKSVNSDFTRHPTETENQGSEISFTESRSLARVISCYMNGEHLLTPRWELIKQIGLIIVAFSGAGLYGVAADDYSLNIGYTSWSMRANFIFGTCLTALVVLYISTDIFFNQQLIESVPVSLTGILTQLRTATQQRLKNFLISIGAAISALPLALLSFTYPIPNISLPGQIVLSIVVEIDNTILHFLPIDLALQNKFYRIPFLPFEYTYKLVNYFIFTAQEKLERQSELGKKRIFFSLKQRLITQLTRFQQRVSVFGFVFNRQKLLYESQLPCEFYFHSVDQDKYCYLESLLSFHAEKRQNPSNSPCRAMKAIFRSIAYVLGAIWVLMSCMGYLIAPFNTLNNILKNNDTLFNETAVSPIVAFIAVTPSAYFLGVLIAFFGGNALRDTYDYLISWNHDDVKIPMQAKLYPKTFLALMMFNIYICCFCYAAAVQLALDNFVGSWLALLRPFAIWCAYTGMPFLSMSAMLDFFRKIIDKILLYCSQADNHELVRLNATIEQLKAGIMLMIDEEFLESISTLSQKQLEIFLDLHHPKDGRDLEMELRLLVLYYKDTHLNEVTMQLLRKIVSM